MRYHSIFENLNKKTITGFAVFFVFFVFFAFLSGFIFTPELVDKVQGKLYTAYAQNDGSVPTSITIKAICGDGIVQQGEECDFGVDSDTGESLNTGGYSTTIDGRQCQSDCTWDAYCGDETVQTQFDEECDDGDNVDDDFCSADCKKEAVIGEEGSSGSGPFNPGDTTPTGDTRVRVEGTAYPNADVNILHDGEMIGTVSADSQANFSFTTGDITPGTATFSVWAEDRFGTRSINLTVTFEAIAGSLTTLSGVFVPPTISLDETEISRGDTITLSGQAVPGSTVTTQIDPGEITNATTSETSGDWSLNLNTGTLADGAYTARSFFEMQKEGLTEESSFSQAVNFFIGVEPTEEGSADLNGDGNVDLVDFSILLFNWETDNPVADINGDSTVSIVDFSIMLFQWTG